MKLTTAALGALLAASDALAGADAPTRVPRDIKGTKFARQEKGKQSPSAFPRPGSFISQGCYSSQGNMTQHAPVKGMTSGTCNEACRDDNYWVSGLKGEKCYCGYALPPKDTLVGDRNCSYPCPWYDPEACGALGDPGYWSVFNIGVNIEATNLETSSTSTTARPTSSSAGDSPTSSATATQTAGTSPTPDSDDSKGGSNTVGIAVGVVIGVIVLSAVLGGAFFFVRRRRNAEIEEDHRRNAAVNAFINGSKPPGSSGSISMTDARLDPVLAHRRMSDGSIADNEDYSRRILRVGAYTRLG